MYSIVTANFSISHGFDGLCPLSGQALDTLEEETLLPTVSPVQQPPAEGIVRVQFAVPHLQDEGAPLPGWP